MPWLSWVSKAAAWAMVVGWISSKYSGRAQLSKGGHLLESDRDWRVSGVAGWPEGGEVHPHGVLKAEQVEVIDFGTGGVKHAQDGWRCNRK